MTKYIIQNENGEYWTGYMWGAVQAAEEYEKDDLMWSDPDVPEDHEYFENSSSDIGWGNEYGETFARAEEKK